MTSNASIEKRPSMNGVIEYYDSQTGIVTKYKNTETSPIDIKWLMSNYKTYNTMLFDGELPDIDLSIIEISTCYLGITRNLCPRWPLRVSLNVKFKENEFEWHETLIHEMIHVWQYVTFGVAGHGKTFKDKCKEFQDKFGIYITNTKINHY